MSAPTDWTALATELLQLRAIARAEVALRGACGERDRGKRPVMGRIASENADIVILTNEDPYDDDPQKIVDDMAQAITRSTRAALQPSATASSATLGAWSNVARAVFRRSIRRCWCK